MRIYLAARYGRRAELRTHRERLAAAGHTVTGRWIDSDDPEDAELSDAQALAAAHRDRVDLHAADAVVSFTERPESYPAFATRGGRHVEFGMALEAGKRIYLVGPRENVFHHYPRVRMFDDLDGLLVYLDR